MSGTRTRLLRWIFASSALLCVVIVSDSATISARAAQAARNPDELLDSAIADFERGRIDQSVSAFDQLVAAVPRAMPQLWQRGIALYYVGRYDDCRKQFEAHRTVNPDDVENAAWHFLCVARGESPAQARAALLPVGRDVRVPMREVYELYKGTMTPEQVLRAAGSDPGGQFYANLYVGLYSEATGDASRGRVQLEAAASDRFQWVGGYMHIVARVHVARLSVAR
jgi:lipoprotein NlpI